MDAVTTDIQPTAPRLPFWGRRVSKAVATVLLIFGGLFALGACFVLYWFLTPLDTVCPFSKADIKVLETTTIRYQTITGVMPTSLEDFVRRPEKHTGPWRKLTEERALTDPWGQPYQYRIPGKHNPMGYDIFSKGPDMKEDTVDDIGNWQN